MLIPKSTHIYRVMWIALIGHFILGFMPLFSGDANSLSKKYDIPTASLESTELNNRLNRLNDTTPTKDSNSIKTSPKKKNDFNDIVTFNSKDSMVLDFNSKKVHLYREAQLKSAQTELEAFYIDVNLTNKELFAKGNVDSSGKYTNKPILVDNKEKYTADSMRYNSVSKKGKVYGLRLVQDQAYIHLGTVLKQNDGTFTGVQGKITTCDADHPHFYLNASKVKVIPNNKALFGLSNLVFAEIPTPIALPFGLAPLQKGQRDGIIFPSLGFNGINSGFYLQNFGYYLGLGPHADIQLNSDAYLNGDFRLGMQSQYFKRYKFKGSLGLQYSQFSNGAEETSPAFDRNRDFSIKSQFNLDPKVFPGFTFGGNINIVTKGFNRRNSRDINNLSNNQFTSSINISKQLFKNKLNISAAARHSQNTQNGDFKLDLPSVNIGVSSLTPFARKTGSNNKWYQQLRLSYSGNIANQILTKDTIIFSDRYTEAFNSINSGLKHSIPISTNIKLFKGILNVSPSFNYQENWHFRGQFQTVDTQTNKAIYRDTQGFFRQYGYNLSTNVKTNIYGTFNNLKWGNIRAIRHTITPSLGFTYAPEIDPFKKGWSSTYIDTFNKIKSYSLFEKSAVGKLEQSRTGSINLSLNNNFQGKRVVPGDSTGKKTEKFNIIDQIQLSTNYNLFADSLKWSDVRGSFNTVLFKKLRINSNANFSPYYRTADGVTLNTFNFEKGGNLLRFKSAGVNVNTTLSADDFSKDKKGGIGNRVPRKKYNEEEAELNDIRNNPMGYYDFNIPWSMTFGYMFNYSGDVINPLNRVTANEFTVSGDISITENWKVSYRTGYNFRQNEIAGSQFSVIRNLHCWQLEFMWVPTGYGKQWVFTLRPVSRLLQDLKLPKRVYSNPALM